MTKVAVFISDLHLGRGDELDDFPQENENSLSEFLTHLSAQHLGHEVDLVVLGDFLDIWGVATESEKTAKKSEDIVIDLIEDDQVQRTGDAVKAHAFTFAKMRGFILSDPEQRRIVFVVGNHDHSLVSKKVQEAVRGAITGGNPQIDPCIEFRLFYDAPDLRTYAEHGNQYEENNAYKQFAVFGNECPGHYFVRLVWNRLEPMEPNLDVWWESFRAIWKNKLWHLLEPAYRFFRQYRVDPRPFERIDVPGIPFFAVRGVAFVPTTGKPLPAFPDILFSSFAHPDRIFSKDRETENQLRALYHDPENREFREWVDQILKQKFGAEVPSIPASPALGVQEYGLFHDENVSAVEGMFCGPGENPDTPLLKGSGLSDEVYDFVVFGHTHEEKVVRLHQQNAKYFNTGTWSAFRDAKGRNTSRLCYVKITRDEGGTVDAVQQFWPLSQKRDLPVAPRALSFDVSVKKAIGETNDHLLKFFSDHYKPGLIGLVGTCDMIGIAIREAQRLVTKDGSGSLWSHAFILGDMRFDRRGPQQAVTRTPYLFESDLRVQVTQPQIRNGAQENWVGKWCKDIVENAAVIDFLLSPEQTQLVLATALQLADEQEAALYPVKELIGTWIAIIMRRMWLPNPFDDPRAMYCSSFVRHCYRESGRDFLDASVSVSNTTPEDIARAGLAAGALVMYKP
jgi:UDP-2,3-diacylglucosamine pyrophosphatase LpxH